MNRFVQSLCVTLFVSMFLSPTASAEETPDDAAAAIDPSPQHRLWYSNASFARVNPLGLIELFDLGWRYRLSDSDHILLRDSYAFVGVTSRVSPAFGRTGLKAEVSPLAIWKAWVALEAVGYFGTFDQATGFPTADAVYDDDTLSILGRGQPTRGSVFTAGTVLQAKAGPIAVRSTLQATRYDIQLDAGDMFFYDQFWDRLAPNGSFMLLNDLDVMAMFEHARVGARWTWTDALIPESNSVAALSHHRVGPLLAWQFSEHPAGTRFNKPTLFALAQWWLQHPYRDGTVSPQSLPLIAVGFAFQGDLLGSSPAGN